MKVSKILHGILSVLLGLFAAGSTPFRASSGVDSRIQTVPIARKFSLPLGFRDGKSYGPRINYKNGKLIEDTEYGVKNPDMQGDTCFGLDWGKLYHAGEDWYRQDGKSTSHAEVTAVADGIVKYISYDFPGAVILIKHRLPPDGQQKIFSLYGHLDPNSVVVSVNQVVSRGQKLGTVLLQYYDGRYTDYHDDSHLHFQQHLRRLSILQRLHSGSWVHLSPASGYLSLAVKSLHRSNRIYSTPPTGISPLDHPAIALMIDPSLPLIDLHRHLDGAVRLETILDLGRQHHLPLPAWEIESLRPHVQVTGPEPGVMAFIAKFRWMTAAMVDYDACRRIAYENVEDAHDEGLDYVELRFSPWFMAETHRLNPAGVVAAVVEGVQQASKDTGLPASLIGILSRTYGAEIAWKELAALLTQRQAITALDMGGDEAHYPGELFVEHFKRARDAGWHVTVHAGEIAGAESVWQAIRELGAERIGHAVRAPEDPALMDYLAEHRIGIESNLTSNVQTSTVPDYASHPLRRFLEHGILATINTDDPGISAITLRHEVEVAAPAAGLSAEQIRQAQRNALEVAFLSPGLKSTIFML
jgi:adenosine deaminase